MKKPLIFLCCILFVGSNFYLIPNVVGEKDEISTPTTSGQANYSLARYVFGTGGILGASNAIHFHDATVGQTVAEVMGGANHYLVSGFWQPPDMVAGSVQEKIPGVLKTFELEQNYPNPFNPQTTIQYQLPNECLVNVEIFNLVGQRIRLLISQIQGPGYAEVVWDGRDEQGKMMGSGVYLYSVIAFSTKENGGVLFHVTKKMLFVK
jgi:hypothetical protein